MFDFRTPLFLILLVAIPVLIFVQRRTHLGTTKWRKRVTFLLRGAALLCAILALANLHRTQKEQRLAVIFLIDTSESVQPIQRDEGRQTDQRRCRKIETYRSVRHHRFRAGDLRPHRNSRETRSTLGKYIDRTAGITRGADDETGWYRYSHCP